ncbi:hypothetical protein Tco_1361758 [Tanacetum coccineum]
MVISSSCLIDNKELTSPEQTAPGKDFSNPLIVDSLLKTIWSSMHHVFTMKHWLVQSKSAFWERTIKSVNGCHKQVAFLEKSTGSAGFHQVIDFLNRSHICYALTKKPDVYISFIKQFWRSAEASTDDNGEVQITATIDGHSMSITEASLRRHLKLDDQDRDEGSLKLNELTNLVTKLSDKVAVLEDDLRKTTKTYSSAFTKLILRVKKLEARVKIGKAKERAEGCPFEMWKMLKMILPNRGGNYLMQNEKGSAEISTAGATKGTASEVPMVSTAEEDISTAGRTVTYSRGCERAPRKEKTGKEKQ